ncbi:MAG: sigma-70 family RNA polymerase sigma factor [Sphingomonadales bacterium]|nr:sigma-70 family RNA polymerase sigma factor [Sphingomonadales bacterium]
MQTLAQIADMETPLTDREFRRQLEGIAAHLRAFARSLCGCRDRADDLAQETMMKAWAARASYRAGTNFKAWTFTILRNQFYSETRRTRFVGEYDQELAERTLCTRGNQEAVVGLADVMRALETLPPANREALILAAVGDFAYDEIADICGVALGTVKSRICRARAMLMAALDSGVLPDARHDYVLEGDAMDLLFAEMQAAANGQSPARAA